MNSLLSLALIQIVFCGCAAKSSRSGVHGALLLTVSPGHRQFFQCCRLFSVLHTIPDRLQSSKLLRAYEPRVLLRGFDVGKSESQGEASYSSGRGRLPIRCHGITAPCNIIVGFILQPPSGEALRDLPISIRRCRQSILRAFITPRRV